jgi:uncharacterized membrane protein
VLFSAQLTPHRSLNRTGFVLVMTFLSVISFATGVAFLIMGAWPVFGFLGLDVLAIYIAFRINFGRARAREEITVTPSELRLRRVSHRGHVVEWVLNPLWVRLDEVVHEEFGTERIYLISRGRRVSVGSFLGAEEKASFAKALRTGLSAAKRGPTYNPVT